MEIHPIKDGFGPAARQEGLDVAAPATEAAIQALRGLIIDGDLQPGSWLPAEPEPATLSCLNSTAKPAASSGARDGSRP